MAEDGKKTVGIRDLASDLKDGEALSGEQGDNDSQDGEWVLEDPLEASASGAPGAEEERLRRELSEIREQWVRTVADLDNFRKRSEREAREVRRYALFDPMRDVIGVVDNLERALSSIGTVEDLKRGVELILVQLRDVLKTHGVREVQALGAAFDPALHDAVARDESEEVDAPTVAEELQRGYMMHDRLLRPALVKVAIPVSVAATRQGGAGDGEP